MTEERITEVETPSGNTHTHTTVVTDGERRSGGNTVLLVVLLLILAAVAFWVFSSMSGAEVAKDNAIAEAASDVGDAAQNAGAAVEDAAQNIGN